MTFEQRIEQLQDILDDIQSTSSLNEKREIIDCTPQELKDDFNCIIECLNGKHIFGYKMSNMNAGWIYDEPMYFHTIREAISFLENPRRIHDLSVSNISRCLFHIREYWNFFQPIVDRELKLGIGNSLLDKSDIAPMLAKKYEGVDKLKYDRNGYFVTEKLDGNRCIAFYDGGKWNFISRNGKPMYVSFDMTDIPIEYVYDGEILSIEQVELSNAIAHRNWKYASSIKSNFNKTSGTINKHNLDKDLVYNIFDVQVPWKYEARRNFIDDLIHDKEGFVTRDVRILPLLMYNSGIDTLSYNLDELLYNVTEVGGEGLMLNLGSAPYTNKRTNNLLKYKDVKTMDMLVLDTYGGTGKYEGLCGGITCQAVSPDGKVINCNVGSGLTDTLRTMWVNKSLIVGRIVEIEYFSLSQDEVSKGTNYYSLRFPRLKKVRQDKSVTSVY